MASTKSSYPDPFKLKTFCLITGASQGIGKQMAIRFSQKYAENKIQNCCFAILARNEDKLNETKKEMEACNPNIKVRMISDIGML